MSWRIVEWDHREQPDFEAIDQALAFVVGRRHISVRLVPDTGSDQYALVIAEGPLMTDEEAQAIYEHRAGLNHDG